MTVNLIRDSTGVTVLDSCWPRCHSCRKQSADVKPLTYVRSDGVRGASYPDCADCRRANAQRLQRMGFVIRAARATDASPTNAGENNASH